MRIVIAGGGVAALESACAARKQAPEAEVVVLSREAVPPYRRPALSRMASEELSDAAFYIRPLAFYAESGIELRFRCEAVQLDANEDKVILADGEELFFDRLIVATGAHCFVPPLPGTEHAMTLREYSDLLELRARLDAGVGHAAVIGGGLLGLELADSLRKRGAEVAVLEAGAGFLPRNLDAEGGAFALAQLKKLPGLTLRFGCKVESITPRSVFSCGMEFPSELTLISAGAGANTAWLKDSGVSVHRGVVTDARMRTTRANVFAAGDVAEVDGCSYGLYAAAAAMGKAAGTNAAGGEASFVPAHFPARLNVFGMKIFSAGTLAGVGTESSRKENSFRKLFFDENNHLQGAELIGDLSEAVALQERIDAK